MFGNMILGLPTMVVCLLLQGGLIVAAFRYYTNHKSLVMNTSFMTSLLVLSSVMVILVVGNLGQVAIWAQLFMLLGEFSEFDQAFYHSMVNFSTLGYGDVVMSDEHKLLGPLESLNGVLMIGVTSAMLLATLKDSATKIILARREESSAS